MAFILGIAQGCQPITSFNYGAKQYGRVRETYKRAVLYATLFSVAAFLCFQLFPRQILRINAIKTTNTFETAPTAARGISLP